MLKKIYSKFGLVSLAFLAVFLLISSSTTAIPSAGPSFTTDSFSSDPSLEFASLTAGKGTATYASLFVFGGVSGTSTYPVDTTTTGLQNANSWVVAANNQSNFSPYLNRAPSPVDAPNGVSLTVSYTGVSSTTAASHATDAETEVESSLGISLSLYFVSTGPTKTYIFTSNSTSYTLGNVASDVEGISSDGFAANMDASKVTSSPVSWAAFGARTLQGNQVAMFGMGWVDTNGISSSGSGSSATYTVSTNAIFGDLDANSGSFTNTGLSKVTINMPYPVEPQSISPRTSNLLPHVTGKLVWNLRHPITGFNYGSTSDFTMDYKLKNDNAFPNVESKFSFNQTELTSNGNFEGELSLTNVGDEVAEDLNVYFPIGPDFVKINESKPIWKIDDTKYNFESSFSSNYNLSVDVSSSSSLVETGSPNLEDFLSYNGWYRHLSNGSLADWDQSNKSVTLVDKSGTVSGVTIDVKIQINSTNGFPTVVLDAIDEDIAPALRSISLSTSYLDDVKSTLESELGPSLRDAFNESFHTYYIQEDTFVPDLQDFELKSFDYWVSSSETKKYYYLKSNVSSLAAAGGNATLNFALRNVPVTDDKFQFIDYNKSTATATSGDFSIDYPQVDVQSSEENYFDVLQYIFEEQEFDGRPMSFGFEGGVEFGTGLSPQAFGLDSYTANTYFSSSAIVTYENAQNFSFFTLANSLNQQFADDEATIVSQVSLNSSVYHPGDAREITVNLENTGDATAGNVEVHVYQGTLDDGFGFDRLKRVGSSNIGTMNSGDTATRTFVRPANDFVGYTPVFAYVKFDSEPGQGAEPVKDYLGTGTTSYEAGGETTHILRSNVAGALFTPDQASLNPTVREPKVEIHKTVSDVYDKTTSSDGTFESGKFSIDYTIENTGQADTTVFFAQTYDTNQVTVDGESALSTSSNSAFTVFAESGDFGYAGFSNINLPKGYVVDVSIEFTMESSSVNLPSAFAYFRTQGDSSLGGTVDTGTDTDLNASSGSSLFSVSAGSAAQEDSQKDAGESSSSSSYSASSSVGASVDTNVESEDTVGIGFIGYDVMEVLPLMIIPVSLYAYSRRFKKQQ